MFYFMLLFLKADSFLIDNYIRMRRTTFHYILHIIKPSLLKSGNGRKTILSEKHFLIAIWKMATLDSYRYETY